MEKLPGLWVWTRVCNYRHSGLDCNEYYRRLTPFGWRDHKDKAFFTLYRRTCHAYHGQGHVYGGIVYRFKQINTHMIIKSDILIDHPFTIILNGIVTFRIVKICYNWFENKSSWRIFLWLWICFIVAIVIFKQRFFCYFVSFLIEESISKVVFNSLEWLLFSKHHSYRYIILHVLEALVQSRRNDPVSVNPRSPKQ